MESKFDKILVATLEKKLMRRWKKEALVNADTLDLYKKLANDVATKIVKYPNDIIKPDS